MRTKFYKKKRKGAVIPLVALAMVVLLGFSALAVDAGSMYLDRREMATAADAAALAGAKALSMGSDETEAESEAVRVAGINGADNPVEVDIRKIDNLWSVDVKVHKIKNTLFAGVLGVTETDIVARSVASWGYLTSFEGGNMIPLFKLDEEEDDKIGQYIFLKEGKMNVTVEDEEVILDNNYGYLDIESGMNTVNTILSAESYTFPEDVLSQIKVGGILEGETGTGQSLIKNVEDRMDKALLINISNDAVAEESARRQVMTGIIPIINYEKFITDNLKANGKGFNTPLKLTVDYFLNFEILDIVVDNHGNGSQHSLYSKTDPDKYEQVTITNSWPGQNKGTIIGRYIEVDGSVYGGISGTNPNPGGYSVKAVRLVDVDYIGD